ncbi:MAG: hypothetical protein M3Y19_00925, partial [Actinomycetota bacterium]|nr:hypothetical protein [Actinomycetota bacterium]
MGTERSAVRSSVSFWTIGARSRRTCRLLTSRSPSLITEPWAVTWSAAVPVTTLGVIESTCRRTKCGLGTTGLAAAAPASASTPKAVPT